MRYSEIITEAQDDLRAEILQLWKKLPPRWKNEDGSESYGNPRFDHFLEKTSDDDLPEMHNWFKNIVAYLAANPKAAMKSPLDQRVPKRKAATLKAILPRAGNHFRKWLTDLYGDDPDDLQAVLKSPKRQLENLPDYLHDDLSITVRDDGLITFWALSEEVERIIGDLPVALYHFTSSKVVRSIRANGLEGDRDPVNRRLADGVYLTTETSGPVISGYIRGAIREHGGAGVMLTIRCFLSELEPDPDDADISSGRHQFVVSEISPDRIVSVEKAD